MENEIVLLCAAYPQINNALYVAWKNYQSRPVHLLIESNQDMLKFFNETNGKIFQGALDIKYIDSYQPRKTKSAGIISKAYNGVWNTLGERLYLRKVFNQHLAGISGADVYFFTRYFNAGQYYWLNKIAGRNKLFFMPSSVYDHLGYQNTNPKNIKEFVYLWRWKIAYSNGIAMGKHPTLGVLVPYIPDKFLQKRVFKTIEGEERDKLLYELDMQKFRVFGADKFDVMYFHDDLVGGGYITDTVSFNKLLADAFKLVAKYFPENRIARKFHPTPDLNETMGKLGVLLPDYIPAEFLYNDNVKMYLGLSSMAIAHLEKGNVVSLMDMVTFRDEATKKGLKDILIKASETDILFPKSLSEFEGILAGITGKR